MSRITGKLTPRRLLMAVSFMILLAMLVPHSVVGTVIVERSLPSVDPSARVPYGIDVATNGSFVVFAGKQAGMIGFMGTGVCLLNGKYNTTLAEFRLPGPDWQTAEPRDVQLGNSTLKAGGTLYENYVYFTEFVRNKIGRLSLYTGIIREWDVPTPNSGPMNLVIDPYRGCLWFTEYHANKIGNLFYDAGTWKFVEYSLPTSNSYPTDIAVDPDYVWFTMSGADKIGRLNPQNGLVDEYSTRGMPWGIIVDQEGFVWFTQKLGDRLARLNPWTATITEIPIPVHSPGNEPLYLANDSDRCIWFTESASNRIGRYVPGLNVFQEFMIPNSNTKPHGIAVTPRLWSGTVGPGVHTDHVGKTEVFFTEEVGNRIGMITHLFGPSVSTTVGWVSSASTTTSSATTFSTVATSTSSTDAAWQTSKVTRIASSQSSALVNTTTTLTDTVTVLRTSTTSTMTTTTTSTSVTTTTSTSTSTLTTTSTILTTTTVTSTSSTTTTSTTTTTTTTSTTDTSTTFSPTVTTPTTLSVTSTYFETTTTTITPIVSLTSQVLTATTTTTTAIVTTTSAARACIIASVAYGSELAPDVWFLRGFRDRAVVSTFAGAQFMQVFNAFYYSFSPKVAELVGGSPLLQAIVRALIYPLVVSLRLAADIGQLCPEASQMMIVVAGVFASSLLGAIYVSPMVILFKVFRRKVKVLGGV